MKKTLSIILSLLIVFGCTSLALATGVSAADAIEVGSFNELYTAMSKNSSTRAAAGSTIKLTADIDFSYTTLTDNATATSYMPELNKSARGKVNVIEIDRAYTIDTNGFAIRDDSNTVDYTNVDIYPSNQVHTLFSIINSSEFKLINSGTEKSEIRVFGKVVSLSTDGVGSVDKLNITSTHTKASSNSVFSAGQGATLTITNCNTESTAELVRGSSKTAKYIIDNCNSTVLGAGNLITTASSGTDGVYEISNSVFSSESGVIVGNGNSGTVTFTSCEFISAQEAGTDKSAFLLNAANVTFDKCKFSSQKRLARFFAVEGTAPVAVKNCTFTLSEANSASYIIGINNASAAVTVSETTISMPAKAGGFIGCKTGISIDATSLIAAGEKAYDAAGNELNDTTLPSSKYVCVTAGTPVTTTAAPLTKNPEKIIVFDFTKAENISKLERDGGDYDTENITALGDGSATVFYGKDRLSKQVQMHVNMSGFDKQAIYDNGNMLYVDIRLADSCYKSLDNFSDSNTDGGESYTGVNGEKVDTGWISKTLATKTTAIDMAGVTDYTGTAAFVFQNYYNIGLCNISLNYTFYVLKGEPRTTAPATDPVTGPSVPVTVDPSAYTEGSEFCAYKNLHYAKTEGWGDGMNNLASINEYISVKDGTLTVDITDPFQSNQVTVNHSTDSTEKAKAQAAFKEAKAGSGCLMFNFTLVSAKDKNGKDANIKMSYSNLCGAKIDNSIEEAMIVFKPGETKTVIVPIPSTVTEETCVGTMQYYVKNYNWGDCLTQLTYKVSHVTVAVKDPDATTVTAAPTTTVPAPTTIAPTTTVPAPTTIAPTTIAVIYGDVNADKSVNAKDVLILKQYLAQWTVTIDKIASDVNADDAVNAKDLLRIRQYLADWDVPLGKA